MTDQMTERVHSMFSALALTTILAAPVLSARAAHGAPAARADGPRAGSIHDLGRGPINPIADRTARRPGDVLTVIISENQDLQNQEISSLEKATSLDYRLSSFNIKPNTFNVLPDLTASSSDEFEGAANVQKSGSFSARVSVLVVDTLPNGNLVLSGRREIRIDGEIKLIEFSGVVRRHDVRADNSVLSERVANALITYEGTGPLTRTTTRTGLGGKIAQALDWLWPF